METHSEDKISLAHTMLYSCSRLGMNFRDSLNSKFIDPFSFQPEIEMNWNIMHFLPEAGACQTNFNVSDELALILIETFSNSKHVS